MCCKTHKFYIFFFTNSNHRFVERGCKGCEDSQCVGIVFWAEEGGKNIAMRWSRSRTRHVKPSFFREGQMHLTPNESKYHPCQTGSCDEF